MSGNTESTSNSIKFAPMPMSALLANLMPLQNQNGTPDSSFTDIDDSDNSFETVSKKSSPKKMMKDFLTPNLKASRTVDIKSFASEKKPMNTDYNKENQDDHKLSNQVFKCKETSSNFHNKAEAQPSLTNSDSKKKNILMNIHNNVNQNSVIGSAIKRTPEISKPPSTQKVRSATPKIKSGIRRFTPTSAQRSLKKTTLTVSQNRDKVRCELFSHNQSKDQVKEEAPCPPPQAPRHELRPVPETPINRKSIPTSYVATPSYPQGNIGNNSKVMFKTTCIKDKKYMFIKKLGTGGSSEVYKVLEMGTSCEYAVKCVYLATDQELAQGYVNEVRLLRELQDSDRVIRLYDYEYDRNKQTLRMVLEAGETDLASFLRARGTALPPALVLHYWEEMLLAVSYIHEHGVIHADLKPANFLLVCGRLKLIDFGIASALAGDATSVERAHAAGTYSYISPEALMGGAAGSAPIKISYRSDVWSLGCILYSFIYGRTPFAHIASFGKLAAILDPNHRIDYPPAPQFPPSLGAALKWCLTYNVRERPTVRELLAIPYLQPAPGSLPQALLDKLKPLVTPKEFAILQAAKV